MADNQPDGFVEAQARNTRCHRCGGLLGMGQAMLLRAETGQVDQIPQDQLGLLESSLQRHMDEMTSDPARVLERLREQMGRSRSDNVHLLKRLLLRVRRMLKGPSPAGHFGYVAFKGTPVAYTATTSGVLYAMVQNNRGGTGSYTLSISVPEDDHGNAVSKTTAVETPSSTDGVIEYVGDLDYVSFQAQADTTYVISTAVDFVVTLYNSRGQQLVGSYYGQAPIAYTATTTEALYVMVQNNRGGTGSYTLSLSVPSDDHGNAVSKATAVEVPSSTDGVIEYVGDLDYFSFQAEAGTTYVMAAGGDFVVTRYSSQGQPIASPYYGQAPIAHTATTTEAIYVTVQNNRGGAGSYTLSISVPEDDHGNAISAATAVLVPSSKEGTIEYTGDVDYFSFQAKADTTYVIATSLGTLDYYYLYLYNSSGQQLASAQGYQGQQTPIAYTATASGELYVAVDNRQRNGTGSYTLTVTVPSDDHGNAISTATDVEVPSSTEGTIEYAGDLDYFSFRRKRSLGSGSAAIRPGSMIQW